LYGVNLRLKNASPRLLLKNTTDSAITTRPSFLSATGDQEHAVNLPTMTLGPLDTVDLDLKPLIKASSIRTDLAAVTMQVTNSGGPGSLIGAAYSTDDMSGLTSDVPLRDYGKIRSTTGSYPWRIDDDYSTIVSITNVGNQVARFQVEIRFPGGPYSIRPRQLAVGETATFDLRQMRDQRQPDRTGKTLPSDINQGQFHWSIVATPGDAHIIGRAEVISHFEQVVSSYSCTVCCPDSGPTGGFDPSGYGLYIDGFAATSSNGQFVDCYLNTYPTNIWWSSLSTWDPGVATFMEGTENLHGENMGSTTGVGSYDYIYYDNDGMDCYQRNSSNTDYAGVDVQCQIPTGETSASDVWGTGDKATVHMWKQTLTGPGDFTGRTIAEQEGNPPTISDTCYFQGSTVMPYKVTGLDAPVTSGNHWSPDAVGFMTGAVTYYRNHGRAPCSATASQVMFISCPDILHQYATGNLVIGITSTQVSSKRHSAATQTKTWP
jgi:hypothetical protein